MPAEERHSPFNAKQYARISTAYICLMGHLWRPTCPDVSFLEKARVSDTLRLCHQRGDLMRHRRDNAAEPRSLGLCSNLSLRAGTSQNELDAANDNPKDGKAPDNREFEDNPDGEPDDADEEPIHQRPYRDELSGAPPMNGFHFQFDSYFGGWMRCVAPSEPLDYYALPSQHAARLVRRRFIMWWNRLPALSSCRYLATPVWHRTHIRMDGQTSCSPHRRQTMPIKSDPPSFRSCSWQSL